MGLSLDEPSVRDKIDSNAAQTHPSGSSGRSESSTGSGSCTSPASSSEAFGLRLRIWRVRLVPSGGGVRCGCAGGVRWRVRRVDGRRASRRSDRRGRRRPAPTAGTAPAAPDFRKRLRARRLRSCNALIFATIRRCSGRGGKTISKSDTCRRLRFCNPTPRPPIVTAFLTVSLSSW